MYLKKILESMECTTCPVKSDKVAFKEFVDLTGAHEQYLQELIDLGWLEPERTAQDEMLFISQDVLRIRKAMRLGQDFDLTTTGVCIIVDLLDRLERLDQEVRQLRRLL